MTMLDDARLTIGCYRGYFAPGDARDTSGKKIVTMEVAGNHFPLGFQSPDNTQFNWGFPGKGPRNLAWAILYDATGSTRYAESKAHAFKRDFLVHRDQTAPLEIDGIDVLIWIRTNPL